MFFSLEPVLMKIKFRGHLYLLVEKHTTKGMCVCLAVTSTAGKSISGQLIRAD